ncbi:MAG TPA: hypothetical protein VF190_06635 [Rhodothermales bacterium]
MADVQILVTGSADAPVTYTVPATAEIRPKVVHAVFDGTGASGSFQPVLEIVSDGGVVVGQSPGSTVTAGGSVEQSWFRRVKRQVVTTAPILQAFVSNIFPNPSGFDYATGTAATNQFDYWVGYSFAVSPEVLANLSFGGCEHFVSEFSPSSPPNQWTVFGINEPFPPGTVPTFCLAGRNAYKWFGGPTVVADTWYRIDLHVVYDTVGLTFNPVLYIDGVNQGVPTGHPTGGAIPGDLNFFFGTDQFCGGSGAPDANEYTWLKNITVGTSQGASDIADLETSAQLTTAIANGSGDNPAASLSILTTNPF